MRCSWKAMILLVFTTIAIQYTAIRTLSSGPFNLYQFPSIHNYSLWGQDKVAPQEPEPTGGPDDLYLFNVTRRTHIVILAATRTGSSFFSQLLNQHEDVFFLFEPLYHVGARWTSPMRSVSPAASQQSNSHVIHSTRRQLLRSLYNCDLYALENHIIPRPANHMTHRLFRRGTSRALCHQPVCDAFGPDDFDVQEGDCVSKCGPLNMTLATQACQDSQHVAIKTVRVRRIEEIRDLVEDPQLNIKVIQLVRDTRGVISSRIDTFTESYNQWHVWKKTGQKPDNINLYSIKDVCNDSISSILTGLAKPDWLKGKYMAVRYEDLARNPLEKTKEIYDYLGLSMSKDVRRWIDANTQVRPGFLTRLKYGTSRNSSANAESWRLKLGYDMVQYIQTVCGKPLLQLGYKMVNSTRELRNMSVSLVEDVTFEPFL
ncbi:carbohydrate sulfotransferase 1-like [Antennarius striatus]|uniref:carbohydrate sulfotransferase 1-like n=1 Tax=Antennarius striatus TaxID=241820 RepID=UPI0035B1E830